jgi:hypothetical protein
MVVPSGSAEVRLDGRTLLVQRQRGEVCCPQELVDHLELGAGHAVTVGVAAGRAASDNGISP